MTVLVVEVYRRGPSRGGGRRRGSRPRQISGAWRREGARGSSCTRRRVGERRGSCTRRREACREALAPGGGKARGEAPPPGGGEVRGDAPAPDEATDGGGGRAGGMARWGRVGGSDGCGLGAGDANSPSAGHGAAGSLAPAAAVARSPTTAASGGRKCVGLGMATPRLAASRPPHPAPPHPAPHPLTSARPFENHAPTNPADLHHVATPPLHFLPVGIRRRIQAYRRAALRLLLSSLGDAPPPSLCQVPARAPQAATSVQILLPRPASTKCLFAPPPIGLQPGPLGAASGRAPCSAVVLTRDGRAGIHRKIEALVQYVQCACRIPGSSPVGVCQVQEMLLPTAWSEPMP
ncbi:skin secretory protein xP2-like [Triticum dicoccoides]|uniref:skin secretory protein xP2-like n=1 Tax=Triticum dicoccoides TaxID=85692 RepID=UPI0018918C4A|nr:skin secretory protein xP2-like [Triticum dicoccoides]